MEEAEPGAGADAALPGRPAAPGAEGRKEPPPSLHGTDDLTTLAAKHMSIALKLSGSRSVASAAPGDLDS